MIYDSCYQAVLIAIVEIIMFLSLRLILLIRQLLQMILFKM